MGEPTKAGDAVDKLVRALNGKFNGLKLDVWKRTAQCVICMRHAGISDILDRRPCPEPELVSSRPSSRRSRPSRAVTRSQVADETDIQSGKTSPADTAENVQPDAGITPLTRCICHHHLQDILLSQPQHQFYGPRMTTS